MRAISNLLLAILKIIIRNLFILSPLIVITPALNAQDTLWTMTYGGPEYDSPGSFQHIENGGYIIAGISSDDIYLIKTDQFGDTAWTRNYSGHNAHQGVAVINTSDNDYVIAGYEYGGLNIFLMKVNGSGDSLWYQEYFGGYTRSLHETEDGGYLIGGSSRFFSVDNYDYCILKVDSLGDTLWTRTYGDSCDELLSSMYRLSDGGYVLAGRKCPTSNLSDVYIIRLDSLYNPLWERIFDFGLYDGVGDIKPTFNNGYLVCGATGYSPEDLPYTLNIDSDGDSIWARVYCLQEWGHFHSITLANDGCYIIAGAAYYLSSDIWILKINEHGDTLWTVKYGGNYYDDSFSIVQSAANEYSIIGYTESFGGGLADIWLLRIQDSHVGIEKDETAFIENYFLEGNYPNPFNASTTIEYILAINQHVTIDIYDILGKQVVKLQDSLKPAGYHQAVWQPKDISSGIYFYKLQIGEYSETNKMVLLK